MNPEPSGIDIAVALDARHLGKSRWQARCPAHDDRNPSLSISDKNGLALFHCHAGCSQEAVIDALRERGIWSRRQERVEPPHDKITEYDYGLLIVRRVDTADGGKRFGQRFVLPTGERVYKKPRDLKGSGKLPLYPRYLERSQDVIVVEGEGVAEAVAQAWTSQSVTTWAGGAKAFRQTDWSPLAARRVDLVADADEPGRNAMLGIARILSDLGNDDVRVALPEGEDKSDLKDWLDDGFDVARERIDGMLVPYEPVDEPPVEESLSSAQSEPLERDTRQPIDFVLEYLPDHFVSTDNGPIVRGMRGLWFDPLSWRRNDSVQGELVALVNHARENAGLERQRASARVLSSLSADIWAAHHAGNFERASYASFDRREGYPVIPLGWSRYLDVPTRIVVDDADMLSAQKMLNHGVIINTDVTDFADEPPRPKLAEEFGELLRLFAWLSLGTIKGVTVVVIPESNAGKSTLALALRRALPRLVSYQPSLKQMLKNANRGFTDLVSPLETSMLYFVDESARNGNVRELLFPLSDDEIAVERKGENGRVVSRMGNTVMLAGAFPDIEVDSAELLQGVSNRIGPVYRENHEPATIDDYLTWTSADEIARLRDWFLWAMCEAWDTAQAKRVPLPYPKSHADARAEWLSMIELSVPTDLPSWFNERVVRVDGGFITRDEAKADIVEMGMEEPSTQALKKSIASAAPTANWRRKSINGKQEWGWQGLNLKGVQDEMA